MMQLDQVIARSIAVPLLRKWPFLNYIFYVLNVFVTVKSSCTYQEIQYYAIQSHIIMF